ncbi:glutamate-cysteine ligase family protein [Candidatus Nanohalovita haloferacivicina]|uniref:glutamate-cysteine ligase family protein n=1 Tax=Candidatus Nanohalovita haloferacivicina TaxID=2978046 RepID=UPI00325FC0DD|nr:Glutamate---cysteine ligase / carboxylate-amine ligase [Candidatus Nanohalobia archaeon BNXNv]
MKAGLELEFWVIDEQGELDYAKPVAERVYFASQEFSRSMIEIQTEPHEDVEELLKEAISKTEILAELAKKDGKRIVPLGTPLNSGKVEVYESERFQIEQEVIGHEVKHAGRTAGLHIHFEKEDSLRQLNTLTALDPLSALMNSSPRYQGKDLADGCRNQVYRHKACGAFPEQRELWPYMDSITEWREKREKLFEKFEKEAEKKGIKPEKFERFFQPENAVWTPVKLRENYPTVEWRAPDTALLTEVIKIVKAVKPIVQKKKRSELPDFKEVKQASEKAITQGLESREVREYIEKMGADPSDFSPMSQQLDLPEKVSREEAREIRLDVAEKLTEDLEEAKEMIG